MNRFNLSSRLPWKEGGDRPATAGGAAAGSSPRASSSTDAPVSAAGSSNSNRGSNGASHWPPLSSAPTPSPRSSAFSPSSASSSYPTVKASPWLSLSAAASPTASSLGKRRVLADADDGRCSEQGPSFFDGGNNTDSYAAAAVPNSATNETAPAEPREEMQLGSGGGMRGVQRDDEDHGVGGPSGGRAFLPSRSSPAPPPRPTSALPSSSSVPPPPSVWSGNGKQPSRQFARPAIHQNGDGADDGRNGRSADGAGDPGQRGGGRRSPLTERPSTPAPPTHHGHQRQQPARLRGAPPSANPFSAPAAADTVMEDPDRFEDISRAEELALTAAEASIQTVKNRQLAIREGIAITHSRLLQRDNGLQLLADVDKLLDATRSLLEDLGLEVENDDDDGNAAATPMDQDAGAEEEEEEEERDPPSPPRQLENRAPVNAVGPPSAVEPDAQTPPQLLPQDQASAEKAASPATASGGDEETIARSHTPLPLPPVEADTSLAPPAGVEGPGADEDAMDAP